MSVSLDYGYFYRQLKRDEKIDVFTLTKELSHGFLKDEHIEASPFYLKDAKSSLIVDCDWDTTSILSYPINLII